MKKNFECRISSTTNICLALGLNSTTKCNVECGYYGKCKECSWKKSKRCKDCREKEGAE